MTHLFITKGIELQVPPEMGPLVSSLTTTPLTLVGPVPTDLPKHLGIEISLYLGTNLVY